MRLRQICQTFRWNGEKEDAALITDCQFSVRKCRCLFKQFDKLLYGEVGVSDDTTERPAINFFMVGNDKSYLAGIVADFYMAAFLTHTIISGFFEGINNLFTEKAKAAWSYRNL